MLEYMLIPWLCAVVILFITVLSFGASWAWAIVPAAVVCLVSGTLAWQRYRQSITGVSVDGSESAWAIFYALCLVAGFAAFIISLIAYVQFLRPYNELSEGATYLDVLPSQSAMAHSDATALIFAHGTSVDQSRTFGFVDARNPSGTMYCVAPVSNQWTLAESGVQFFAAGYDCCGKRSGFGCGESGTEKGAMVLAREDNAELGFKNAVEGAAVHYGLQPGNGYLLLTMVADPFESRQDKLDNAVKLALIFGLVYLLIACAAGFFAYNSAHKW